MDGSAKQISSLQHQLEVLQEKERETHKSKNSLLDEFETLKQENNFQKREILNYKKR